MVSYHVEKIHDKKLYIIANQDIISTKRHKLLTIKYIDKCDERLAFEGGVAGIVNFEMSAILLSRPGWLMCALNRPLTKET
jgi:hypothetical protein